MPKKITKKNKQKGGNFIKIIPMNLSYSNNNFRSKLCNNCPLKKNVSNFQKKKRTPILIGRIPIRVSKSRTEIIKDWINKFPYEEFENLNENETKELIELIINLQENQGFNKFTNMSYSILDYQKRSRKKLVI